MGCECRGQAQGLWSSSDNGTGEVMGGGRVRGCRVGPLGTDRGRAPVGRPGSAQARPIPACSPVRQGRGCLQAGQSSGGQPAGEGSRRQRETQSRRRGSAVLSWLVLDAVAQGTQLRAVWGTLVVRGLWAQRAEQTEDSAGPPARPQGPHLCPTSVPPLRLAGPQWAPPQAPSSSIQLPEWPLPRHRRWSTLP